MTMIRSFVSGFMHCGTAVLALTLAACGTVPQPDEQAEERIQSILEREPMAEAEYTEAVRCLPTWEYDQVDILDSRRLVFYDHGKDEIWLNQLTSRCVGLRPHQTLLFELHGNQACNLDTVRGVEPFFHFFHEETGTCTLGKFEPITKAQLELIEQALSL